MNFTVEPALPTQAHDGSVSRVNTSRPCHVRLNICYFRCASVLAHQKGNGCRRPAGIADREHAEAQWKAHRRVSHAPYNLRGEQKTVESGRCVCDQWVPEE